MENLKNMLILKNLPSNIIDEALIILKPHSKINKEYYLKNNFRNLGDNDIEQVNEKNDYIIKEAEYVIQDFIENIEKKQYEENNDLIQKKYNRLKIIAIALSFVGLVSIIF